MAEILGIQIIGILFGFFMMYYTFLHYKRKEFSVKEYGFWLVLWTVFIVITLFPNILDPILKSLSISRTLDFFIIVGFLFLIGMIFYTYANGKRNQKKLEEVVRKIAIEKK